MNRSIILVVDDVEANREALASSFSHQFTIAYAADGFEAQTYIEAHHADVAIILLDIIMPKMNGIDFLKWISSGMYRNIPVIAITAEPTYQIEALKNGAWDFVVKPLEQEVLHARVNNVLGRYGFLREKEINRNLEAANTTLAENQRKMDHLVNSIPGGIAIYRITERLETLFFSDGVAELSGHTHEDYLKYVGDDASRIIYPADKERLMNAALTLLQDGQSVDEACRIYHKDGHLVWVRFNGLPIEQTEKGIILYTVLQGISPQTKLYQSVLDETQTAVYACDVNTYDILYFNHRMAAFAGIDPTEVTGKKCYNYFFHRDTPCTFCHMKDMQKDQMLEREFVYPGTQNTYNLKGKLLNWNGITAHIEYIEDVTEKKVAEAKSTALLKQLGSIMDHVPGAMCLYEATDTALKPVIHNKAFYDTFGYSEENTRLVDSKTNFLNVHPDDVVAFKEKTLEAIQTGQPFNYTYRFFNDRKGAYIWLYMCSVVVKEPDGTKLCYVSYTDVTEERRKHEQLLDAQESIKSLQKQAEHTLKEYQTLVNTVPGAIVLYELDGEKVLTKYYSDGLCTLSGYTREERDAFNNRDALALVYDEDLPLVRAAMQDAMKNESNVDISYRILTKNGPPHYIHLNATFVRSENGKAAFHAVFSDVDKMKRLEIAAQEQQLRYEVAIKSSGINIWEYDIQTDCLTVISNSSRIKQNCYTIEHYVASTIEHDYVREDSLETFYNIYEQLRAGAKEVTADIWYKTTNEAGWWCEHVIYTTVFDSEGKPQRAFGAGRDVTREKEAIRKFQEELHYRAAMQGNGLGSIKINLTQNLILEGKSPFPTVSAWIESGDADHYFAKNITSIPEGKRKENFRKDFNRQALINRFSGGDYSLSLDATQLLNPHYMCWLQYNIHLMKNPENDDVIAFMIVYDVTDDQVMKLVMKTVTQTDYEFFVVVDGSSDSAKNYTTSQQDVLFSSNESFETRCDALIRETVCDEDLERVLSNCKIKNIFAHIKNGDTYKFNYSVREKNGEIRRKQLQFTLIYKERKTFLMTRIDVSAVFFEQEQTQKRLKAALHEAQSAAKAKTDFLSRMSHDIRTPLNAIIGLSGLGSASHSLTEMQNYYKQIEDAGKYLLSIINDVLDMSKIEGRTLVLHPTVVNLQQFIEETIAIVMPMILTKNIQFEVKEQGIASDYMRFDATYLRQVVVNLLSNAVKFTPEGGHIELCLENLAHTGHSVRNRMIIRDNGIGISADFLSKVFLPFEQENTDNDLTRKGTGLGLSIVKSIVDLMGGSIRVESELGKGTAFIIEWDLETAEAEEKDLPIQEKAAPIKTADLSGCQILLCEDHPLNAQIATKLLEKEGMIITHAENGQRAIAQFSQSPPYFFDAILMDIRMPVMDGLAATQAIRSLDRHDAQTVPIIAMTANAFAEDIEQSLNAGMNAHLAKPIEPQRLFQTLLKQLSMPKA